MPAKVYIQLPLNMFNDQVPKGCLRHIFKRKVSPNNIITNLPTQSLHFNTCCDFSDAKLSFENPPPIYTSADTFSTSLFSETVDRSLAQFDSQLRDISLKIHAHPETNFEERYAHDLLSNFMSDNGFNVTRRYLGLETAWKAEYTHRKGGRVVGINSEMDALSFGHGCGHNLIAASGCAVALAIKATLQAHDIAGKIVLLGTPAEEGGGGKAILLERGAYKEMDFCIMCHPSPGPTNSAIIGSTLSMHALEVEYFGHSSHAGASPWEGRNALDAAFLAYSSISVLRQQIKPDHRVHGIVQGKDWSPNVIPDYACMRWYVRAPTYAELVVFVERVRNCFEAGALATSCKFKITPELTYYDLHQNNVLAEEFRSAASRYGVKVALQSSTASTDFGNVSYRLPALHPGFAIPTEPNGGNHTPAFVKAAATPEAHAAMMKTSALLALTGLRALSDDAFFRRVKEEYECSKRQWN